MCVCENNLLKILFTSYYYIFVVFLKKIDEHCVHPQIQIYVQADAFAVYINPYLYYFLWVEILCLKGFNLSCSFLIPMSRG